MNEFIYIRFYVRRIDVDRRRIPFLILDYRVIKRHGIILCLVILLLVREGSTIKFPNVDLVVDSHGINKISDPLTQFNRIKIEPKKIKVVL